MPSNRQFACTMRARRSTKGIRYVPVYKTVGEIEHTFQLPGAEQWKRNDDRWSFRLGKRAPSPLYNENQMDKRGQGRFLIPAAYNLGNYLDTYIDD